MTDTKCVELGRELFQRLKEKFPELELVSITESAESRDSTWVNVVMPHDEEREITVRELASELSVDILLESGHHITVSSATDEERQQCLTNAGRDRFPT